MRAIGVLLGFLLLASPAVRAWEVRINEGLPLALGAGTTGEFEFAVTRAPTDPQSFFDATIYEPEDFPAFLRPFYFVAATTARCSVDEIGFLPPPGYVTSFQVSPIAAGETVRCRIRIETAADAAPGSYPLVVNGPNGSAAFTLLIVVSTSVTSVPAGTPVLWLALVFLLLLAARRAR